VSVGFNVLLHLIFVLLCLGLGYLIRFSMEEFKELDRQVSIMQQPEPRVHASVYQPQPGLPSSLPSMGSALQAKADPAKLNELKTTIKK